MNADAPPMLEARDLVRSYGARRAVDGLSLSVAAGETYGLLGPNGAGKSTTVALLLGVLRPDGGEVRVAGEPDPTRPAVRRAIGGAPQALSLYETLTAAENLTFFAQLYGLAGQALRDRVAWGLDFAGLTERASERVGRYSGGMKRRLNIACALVHDPPVLLLDEPTVGVDPQSREAIFERIEALKADGRTVLYTTHYLEEAERLCDRVGVLDHGRLLAEGTVAELVDAHGGAGVVDAELVRPPDDAAALVAALTPLGEARLDGEGGRRLRVTTADPLGAVARLSALALEIRALRVERADLGAVFLQLTGRSLRD